MTDSSDALPLSGIRVLDLTHVWSGPSATRLLAGLGAEVIKIEGAVRWDFLRGTGTADARSRYPDQEYGADPWNRNAWFNTVNTDKRGVVVNLKDPDGLELALRLAAQSQLVVANFRPGVLDRMGLGYASLRERRHDISLIEMTGYGSSGPMAGLQAYGAQFDAMSGSAFLTGNGRQPLLTGFALSDPIAGLAAATAATSVIAQWRQTGRGNYIEVVQRDAMVPLHGEYLLAASRDDHVAEGLNADGQIPVQGMFGARHGRWLALSVHHQRAWERLLGLLDEQAAASLEEYRSVEDARSVSQYVHDVIADWVLRSGRSVNELVRTLQRRGIAAAPVNTAAEIYQDADFVTNGFLVELDHPRVGRHRYPGLPLTIDGERCAPRGPAPLLDADTDDVFRERLGLTEPELSRLRERGVIGVSENPALTGIPESTQVMERIR